MYELRDLSSCQCRYPVESQGKHHLFCGRVTRSGSSWCDKHEKVVIREEPPRVRRR